MTRLVWLLDPESAAVVTATYDQLTSPRRGGPRFVDPGETARADAITADPRTTEQLAHDGFLQLLTIGTDVAPDTVIGTNRPAVRVLVTEQALRECAGHGRIEGQPDPVSIPTVQRTACDTGSSPSSSTTPHSSLSTSGGRSVDSPADNGSRWPPATAAAGGQDATGPPRGPKHTTSTNGTAITETPMWSMACCSVATTTCCSTTTAGASRAPVRDTGSSRPARRTPHRPRSRCRSRAPPWPTFNVKHSPEQSDDATTNRRARSAPVARYPVCRAQKQPGSSPTD